MAGEPKLCVVLVVARADNGVIGKAGGLPWRISSDLKRFRALTMGKPVVMGRKTFESIGGPLNGRDNIVVSRNPTFGAEGILVARSFLAALDIANARARARSRGCDEIVVIGGAQIYAQALPLADAIELTEVHARPEGDTFFPPLPKGEWKEVFRTRRETGPRDSAPYSFVRLERRKPSPRRPG